MADLISRAAALDAIDCWHIDFNSMDGAKVQTDCWRAVKELPAVDAIPVEYLMEYAQLPTEFAIAAWRKQDKDAQEKQIKRLDKPMSFDDALNLVNEVFPLEQKEQEAQGT